MSNMFFHFQYAPSFICLLATRRRSAEKTQKHYHFKSQDAYVNEQRQLLRLQQTNLYRTSNSFAVDTDFSLH